MNRYYEAMEQCAPPEGLRERLREKTLQSRPKNRRRLWIAALAAVLALCMGAAAIWDPLLLRRFGPGAALSRMGGATFQEVNVTAVCGDVELTVTQALCSETSIHLILEYRLPEGVEADDASLHIQQMAEFYLTGDYTWEEYRDRDGAQWARLDWSSFTSYGDYLYQEDNSLRPFRPRGSASASCVSRGYDPDARTLTCYVSYDSGADLDFTAQPLTILTVPPIVERDGERIPVTDHPAIVTFQPAYDGPQSRSGVLEEGERSASVKLSPFALSLEAEGMGYASFEEMVQDTWLRKKNGGESPVSLLGYVNGGSSIRNGGGVQSVQTIVHFLGITDVSEYTAVRIGEYVIALD